MSQEEVSVNLASGEAECRPSWWSRKTSLRGKMATGQTSQFRGFIFIYLFVIIFFRVFIFKAMGSRGITFIIAPNWKLMQVSINIKISKRLLTCRHNDTLRSDVNELRTAPSINVENPPVLLRDRRADIPGEQPLKWSP